jgi:inhibitor of cysteine peptidase
MADSEWGEIANRQFTPMSANSSLRPASLPLLTAAILLWGLSLCQAQSGDLVLTENDNGQTVAAVVQQAIVVQLRGNITTGYTWSLTSANGNSVSAAGPSTYVPDEGGGVGVGGTFSFPFLAAQTGETTLSFSYERPGDPGSLAQTFTVTISVTNQPGPPLLSIALKGTNVVISWPIADSNGFYLEGARSLPSAWAALNVLPIPDGLDYTVTLAASGQPLFFRLHQ